jgi:hypothetical protein
MNVPLNVIATGFPRCGTQAFGQYILRTTDLRYIRDPRTSSMDYSAFEEGRLSEYFQSALKLGRPTFHKNNSYILNAEFTKWFADIPEISDKTHVIVLIGDVRTRLVSWYNYHANSKARIISSGQELSSFLQSVNTDSIQEYYNSFAKYGLCYSEHLSRLVKHFGSDKIHVIKQHDLLERPYETIGALANKLNFAMTDQGQYYSSNTSAELEQTYITEIQNEELLQKLDELNEQTNYFCDEHGVVVSPLTSLESVNKLHVSNPSRQGEKWLLKTVSLKDEVKPQLASVLVIGNGPSAALLNFDILDKLGIHTVGMNSAYRLWNKYSYRPTYYVCMDTVVIMSHAEAICSLIKEGRIKRFLLRNDILSRYPELKEYSNVDWFDDLYGASAEPIFTTEWITTGSWSIRWMANMGYQIIGSIGIDAKYQQLLKETTQKEGSLLEISKTPTYNPNYFFDDYQQAGDAYNIPNDPSYMALQGGSVHQDALVQTSQDIDVYFPLSLVVDLSPISDHGAFKKCSYSDYLSHTTALLVTTFFYRAGSEEEFALNIDALCHNLSLQQLSCIVLLFEGDLQKGLLNVRQELSATVQGSISSGKLRLIPIEKRPSYHELFSISLGYPASVVIVANSDIIFDVHNISNIIAFKAKESPRAVFALTRWNITGNGVYPQGQVPAPPWQEKSLDDMASLADINYLSYDTYVFNNSVIYSDAFSSIYVGTFGCDTALAATLRIEGFKVLNPCISLKTHHIDNKPRNYSSELGSEQVRTNVNSFLKHFEGIYETSYASNNDLPLLASIDRSIVSVGIPRPPKHFDDIGWWYSLFRLFGFTPWTTIQSAQNIQFNTYEIDSSAVIEHPDELACKIQDSIRNGRFIEFIVHGNPGSTDYLSCFLQDYNLEQLRKELFRYDRQSVIHPDLVSSQERRAYDRLMLLIKDLLNRGAHNHSASLFRGGVGGRHANLSINSFVIANASSTPSPTPSLSPSPSAARREYSLIRAFPQDCKLLIIDPTPIGSNSATGQIKKTFFGHLPLENIIQVWEHTGSDPGLRIYSPSEGADPNAVTSATREEDILTRLVRFLPSIVYFRSTESVRLHEFHQAVLNKFDIPSILHIMDDWEGRMIWNQGERSIPGSQALSNLLRRSIEKSEVKLSICKQMSREFRKRYSCNWIELSNAVEIRSSCECDRNSGEAGLGQGPREMVSIKYMGGLAEDMNCQSILDIASEIDSLGSEGVKVEFEIYTMDWYLEWANRNLSRFSSVKINGLVPADAYVETMLSADVLVIAYNFDEKSIAYTQLSMANKLPEILAAERLLFAYGPSKIATIEEISRNDLGVVVDVRDAGLLRSRLREVILDADLRRSKSGRAKDFAKMHYSLRQARHKVNALLGLAAKKKYRLE